MVCPTCQGTGKINGASCPNCAGDGRINTGPLANSQTAGSPTHVITQQSMLNGESPYTGPIPPPPSDPLSSAPQRRLRGMALGIGIILLLCASLGIAHSIAGAAPTRGKTVTVYIQGTPVVQTTTPGPSPTPETVYIAGTPIVIIKNAPTPSPQAPYPTLTPYPTWTPPPGPAATATPRPILTLHDAMDGAGPEFASSGDLNVNPIGPDADAENRGSWAQDWIIWQAPNISGFSIIAYYCTYPGQCDPNHPNTGIVPMAIEESADGASWCTPGHTQAESIDPNHPDWTQVIWARTSGCVAGASYLRVTWEDTDQSYPLWDPALGDCSIQYQP